MSNPQKGEIDFQIGGKTYTYLLGTYGLAKLEQRQGKPWPAILKQAVEDGWGADMALAMFHCGLLLYHEPITEKEASRLLDELTVEAFTKKFVEAIKLQFPNQEAESSEHPILAAAPKAGNGTGIPASATG
jgi:hypothetical protein